MKTKAKKQMILLELLSELSPDSSKTTLRSWLEQERIVLDGAVVKKGNTLIEPGQKVEVLRKSLTVRGDIKILFEDKHVIVIEKPHGLLSVATDFDKSTNAHSILKDRVHPRRVYPVHRLDRETSGVMMFVYTEKARDDLKEQFFHHTIEREYFALLEGHLEPKKGTWKSFLQEDENYFVSVHPSKGQDAITHYDVIKHTRHLSLVRFRLETGRKNQIRVHCKEAKHPIFGDLKYGAKTEEAPRLFLHAAKLAFIHPETGKKMTFTSTVPWKDG